MKKYKSIEDRILHCKYYRDGGLFSVSQIIQATNNNGADSRKAIENLIECGFIERMDFKGQELYRKSAPHFFVKNMRLANWTPPRPEYLNPWLNLEYTQ